MSNITEKRSFKIPPCTVDKDLIEKIGEFLQKEFDGYLKEKFEETKIVMEEEEFYKKYPEELNETNIRNRMGNIKLSFELDSDERRIESSSVKIFVGSDWPDKAEEILIKMQHYSNGSKDIYIHLYLNQSRTSAVSVSGINGTWVNGVADQLEGFFEKKQLPYHLLVNHFTLRAMISLAAWSSLSFAVLLPLWPLLVDYFKEGTQFITFYLIIMLCFSVLVIFLFEYLWRLLFPRFEYGRNSSKTARKIVWELLVGSGFISALILKLLGM
jgi:hypothetical protein